MDHFEMVEKLRQAANVSYEEAKDALEKSNWDLLDAMVSLEKNGKIRKDAGYQEEFKTKTEEESNKEDREARTARQKEAVNGFFQGIGRFIQAGNEIFLDIRYKGEPLVSLPLTVIVLLAILISPILPMILIIAFISLFFNVRYTLTDRRKEADKHKSVSEIFKAKEDHKEDENS